MRVICYCYGYTVQDIERDVRQDGSSAILERIQTERNSGQCRCAEKNPSGS